MNTPNDIRIDNPQFLKKQPSSYNCYIILGKSYLSCALIDEANTTVFGVRHFDYKNQIIGKNDFEQIFSDKYIQKASRYYLAINAQKRTIAPSTLVNENQIEKYIQHQFELNEEESLHLMHVANEFCSIFALKKDSVNYFKNRLSQVSIYDANACVLKTYPKHFSANKETQCFISASNESTTISVYHQQKLLFHRSYVNAGEAEILYHTFNALKQFALKAENTHVQLHGENAKLLESIHQLFEGRVGELGYIHRIHEISFPEDLYAQPQFYFFNLFSLVLCVS